MKRSHLKAKGRRENGQFLALPYSVLESDNFATLSAWATKLLLDLCAQLRFKRGGAASNGDLSAAWTLMIKRGWRSKGTLHRSVEELRARGLIIVSRQGGRNRTTLYAVTWLAVDECGGKLDIAPTKVAPGNWRQDEN